MYYQTTELTSDQRVSFTKSAISQDELIYETMKKGGEWTCEDFNIGAPITSIRRALNTLEGYGKIERVRYKMGIFGRPIGVYKLKTQLKLL